MRERIKARFQHEGINLAVAQRVMWQESAPSAASHAGNDASPGPTG
jgi:small conductance mechanosensitive channel